MSQVEPYAKNTELFGCDSNTAKYRNDNRGAWSTRVYCSYGVNECWLGTTSRGCMGDDEIYRYRRMCTIQYPAECMMIGEVTGALRGPTSIWRNWASVTGDACYYHNEGANVGFFDGHAKWFAKDVFRSQAADSAFWIGGA